MLRIICCVQKTHFSSLAIYEAKIAKKWGYLTEKGRHNEWHTIHAYCVTKFLLHLIQLMTHSSHGVRDQEGLRSAHTKSYLHRWLHYFLQLLQIAPIHLSPPSKVHILAYFLQTLRCNFSFTLLHDLDKLFGKAAMDGSPKGSRTGVQKCNTSSILKKMVQL